MRPDKDEAAKSFLPALDSKSSQTEKLKSLV